MAKKETHIKPPIYETATKFLRGQAAKIFANVVENDDVVIVNKNSKPQVVIISYDKYEKLKYEEGANI